jgi:hypothetical protein
LRLPSSPLSPPFSSPDSRCRRRWQSWTAGSPMFSWILRGCRDECSATDQLKQVWPLNPLPFPSNSRLAGKHGLNKRGNSPFPQDRLFRAG